MDLQKYEEALDDISEINISKFFNNDRQKYIQVKLLLWEEFKKIHSDLTPPQPPFFLPYFKNNFIFLCQNAHTFMGAVFYAISNRNIADVKDSFMDVAQLSYITSPTKKLIIAENLYKDIHKRLVEILNYPQVKSIDIDILFNLMKPLKKVKYHRQYRHFFSKLLTEFHFSLQLLLHAENLNRMFFPSQMLLKNYLKGKNLFSEIRDNNNSKYTLLNMIIDDLQSIYNRIAELHTKPKMQYRVSDGGSVTTKQKTGKTVSDSVIKIKMIPFHSKKKNNVISINNNDFDEVQNSPFDLLYYLLWLRVNYPDDSAAIEFDGIIPQEHINEITKNDEHFDRFDYTWNRQKSTRIKDEKRKTVSKINKLLTDQFELNFNPIVPNANKYYMLTNRFKPDNIELIPYDKNI